MTPTPEQTAIVTAARETTDNLLISALAGAAKTSTLVLIAQALPKVATLTLAFNKRIAVEMKERLPPNCECKTLNGIGYKAWLDFLGKRCTIDKDKGWRIMTALVGGLPDHEKHEAYEVFPELLRAVAAGKTCGYVPDGQFSHAKGLMNDAEFFDEWLDEIPTDLQRMLIREASIRSMKEGYEGTLDFDDQILLPTVFPVAFPQYPLVMVDEAQDLSALNHAMLRKIAKRRLIAVGDPCQAIYGFRGAHEESMSLLQKTFSMKELHLTISFRCPVAVVEAARFRAPAMQYPEWAQQGSVLYAHEWGAASLPETAVILCRNNAPLFTAAIALLKAGRYPELVGNDIGKSLLKVMKKLGPPKISSAEADAALTVWAEAKKAKSRNKGAVDDQADCIRVFLDEGTTLAEAIIYAEHIFASSGPVKLMTGHKAKGLEFDDVFILNQYLLKKEGQDQNLRYVMMTRAKRSLTFIKSEDYTEVTLDEQA